MHYLRGTFFWNYSGIRMHEMRIIHGILLYFTLIISQQKKYIQIHIHKKAKMPREGQKQEQAPLQMATQATMYDKYTINIRSR